MNGPARSTPGLSNLPAAAVVGGVMLMLTISPSVLTLLHLNYATPSGAAWEKVHPGSDLVLGGFALAALRADHPRAWLAARARAFPGAMMFLATTLFLIAYLIAVAHAPFTPLIDTFLVPVVLLVALVDLPPPWKARLETALHLFVAVNAVLGVAEFVTGWRLVPVEVDGVAQTAEMESRAFGLLGHPLASAAMAGLYAVVLMLGGGPRLPARWRMPALLLQFMALGAFGGRTALVMTILGAILATFVALLRFLAGRQASLLPIALGLLLAPVALAAVAMVAASGFFDNVLNRFVDDNGSAAARHAIFEVFAYLSWSDLLFGPDQDLLASLQHLVGIEVGVESFWLGFILAFGLLPSLVFFVGFGLFVANVLRHCSVAAWGPLLFFIGIVSTSISLSAKSTMLGQFVTVVVILLPRATVAVPSRRVVPGLVPIHP